MAAVDIESVIKKGVEQALNEPILNGKSVLEWAEIGIHSQEQPQWISVKDRMPAETHSMFFKFYGTPKWRDAMWREESDHVLVAITFEDGSQFVTSGYTQDGRWSTGISKVLQYTVTHWMPLPEPPEGGKPNENTL